MRGGLLICVAAVLFARHAQADDFFKLSPGPLALAHQELDDHDQCTKCHELGKGVTDFLCLDCHHHEPLRLAIKAGRGLHAGFKENCRKCHADHKGRDALIVDWGPVGGRQSFKHRATGFDLTGLHEKVACTACHRGRLKSGRTSFTDVLPDCDNCHKNPHQFTSRDLREACTKCHTPGEKKKLKISELFFDHEARSGFVTKGKHAQADCLRCHEGAKMAKPKGPARGCASCHRKDSPHGRAFARASCAECHSAGGSFKEPSFDHAKTGFPLFAKHQTKRCGNCHKQPKQKLKPDCQGCHKDPHKKRFPELDCKDCHGFGGTDKKILFAHDKATKLELTGKHKSLSCRDCHRGRNPRTFERFTTVECMGCHAHQRAHDGQFKGKPCLGCHLEGGQKQLKFDHQRDARFATTGYHQELVEKGLCKKCHAKGQFKTGKLACGDCHRDRHQGELGPDCRRCHPTESLFKEISFDHDRLTKFTLEAKHEAVTCEKCHPGRRYRSEKQACVDCHAGDDPHKKKLGTECQRCHIPDRGAPKFDHERMTTFARKGKHQGVSCNACHRASFPGGAPPKLGWTRTLPKEERLDRTFPSAGRECALCHFDPHDGAYGRACETCHSTETFRSANRAVHDTGAFRLEGTHDLLPCQRCHQQKRPLAGLGVLCGECHRADDVHRNALGDTCGRCHSQIDWRPARFSHAQVGFSLRGAHATARCEDCHRMGVYAGTPRDCRVCHEPLAQGVTEPLHEPSAFGDCGSCHLEVSFSPARRTHPWFGLQGTHAVTRCSACHQGVVYRGTPRDCVSCHRAAYLDPSNRPNHVAAGLPEQCDQCHTPVTWMGARFQHQAITPRGVHVALTCDQCHPGAIYDGAFGGRIRGWDCASCHGTLAPVARRPADHDLKGRPETCELCHQETAWLPARDPR